MKKTVMMVFLILLGGFLFAARSHAVDDRVFLEAIEKAADQAVTAWMTNQADEMKEALKRLALNEAYLMVVGKSTKDNTYLGNVPKSLGRDLNAVSAYLYLIRKEREGISLLPASQFGGKTFDFIEKGGR